MLKEHSSFILDMQKTIDIGITAFSFIAAYFIKRHFEDWMKLDLKYIDNWSLFNDFKILVLTAKQF